MLDLIGESATRRLLPLAGSVSLMLASTGVAHASTGCDSVNSGFWNITGMAIAGGVTTGDFEEGDQITFNLSTSSGTATVRIRNPFDTAATYAVSTTPIVEIYTVTAADLMSVLPGRLQLRNDGPSKVNSTATCVAAGSGGGSGSPTNSGNADRSEAVTNGFLQSRVNGILLSNPSATSLVNRSQPYASVSVGTDVASNASAFGSAMGLGGHFGAATGRGASRFDDADETALGSRNIQFRNSLSQMRREARAVQMERDRMALGAGDGGAVPIVYDTYSPWDVWIEGRFSGFDDDAASLDRDGHVGVLHFGGDYRITPDMIIGGLVQFDWAKDKSNVLLSKVDGSGWMIGPYVSARIHESMYFDFRAAWGRSSNNIDVAGASGSFDTYRWLVRGALTGNWQFEAWRITPSAELTYVKESADGYTNSAATFVSGQSVSLGRLQFGPEVGYRFVHTSDSFLEPFGAIRGVWDFDDPNVAVVNGYVVGPGDVWGRLEGGLNWMSASGLFVRGSATWDGMGAGDYNGYTLQGTVNVPLN